MNTTDFRGLPYLLRRRDVMAITGYSRATILKYLDCGVLEEVRPAGSEQSRFRKRQIAGMLQARLDVSDLSGEPMLLPLKTVQRLTGYAEKTLANMVRAKSLTLVRTAGAAKGKFRKQEIAELLGYPELA